MHRWQFPLVAAALLCVATAHAEPAADPSAFINDLGTQAIRILQTQHDAAQRKAAFSKIFNDDFDAPAIGRFVLGRYWRTASPDQQKQYVDVFGKYIVTLYANRFSAYAGEQFKVVGARPNDAATATVSSQIIQPNGGPPIAIGWQVAKEGTTYKITDVTVDNLSLAITKRDEFASVIEQNGGNVQALIDQLKQKINQS